MSEATLPGVRSRTPPAGMLTPERETLERNPSAPHGTRVSDPNQPWLARKTQGRGGGFGRSDRSERFVMSLALR